MVRHSAKPIPIPSDLVVTKGWNNLEAISGAIPEKGEIAYRRPYRTWRIQRNIPNPGINVCR